jgi:YVTN family beta-propeller protein
MRCTRYALILSIAALAGLAPATTASAVAASRQPAGNTTGLIAGCRVAATIPLGGAPLWIAGNYRIYVPNNAGDGNTVSVISARRNMVIATIPVGSAPAGVATDWKTNRIYVANRGDGTVSVINGHTETVTATIPVGGYLDGIAANWKTNHIYVAQQRTVSVINGGTTRLPRRSP